MLRQVALFSKREETKASSLPRSTQAWLGI
jgi:hypothetical protein